MEKLIETQGIYGLLSGIIVISALHLIAKLGSFVFDLLKKKNEVTEKTLENLKISIDNLCTALATNVSAVHSLEERMRSAEQELRRLDEFKIDIRRLFGAIKEISGDNWPEIKKTIMEDIL